MPTKALTVRITEDEMKILKEYCIKAERTQSDVVREFIRSLSGDTRGLHIILR